MTKLIPVTNHFKNLFGSTGWREIGDEGRFDFHGYISIS
jgi:hypothetical protein